MSLVNNRRGRNRGPRRNVTERQIGNHLRRLNLTTDPTWHLVRGRKNLGIIPMYKEDASYVRKVRIEFPLVAGTKAVTTEDLMNVVWSDRAAYQPFTNVVVKRIDAWAPASANAYITVVPSAATVSSAQQVKSFQDYGIQGSARPHVAIVLNPKDALFLPIGNNTFVATFFGNGTEIVIADFLCHFTGTVNAASFRRLNQNSNTETTPQHPDLPRSLNQNP